MNLQDGFFGVVYLHLGNQSSILVFLKRKESVTESYVNTYKYNYEVDFCSGWLDCVFWE